MPRSPQMPADPNRGRAATPVAFIQAILLAYSRYGIDPTNALTKAGIYPEDLSNPATRLTANQMEIISGHAMQELDDEALGWFSRKLPWGSYGMLCRASLSSPTLGIALQRWCRHHRLLTEDILLDLSSDGAMANFTISCQRDLGEVEEFCLVSNLRYVLGYACWAIDSRIPLVRVDLPFPAPAHQDAYPLLFHGPTYFGSDHSGFCFDARYLELPIRRDEPALQSMLQRALPLTVRQYRRDRLLLERVRQLLREHPVHSATAEQIALQLHVSVRTLYRKLWEEGTSLQLIKDEIRRDKAIELLHRSQLPIKQIAAKVGFGNEKSFVRAFKTWTGKPPGAYRKTSGKNTPP